MTDPSAHPRADEALDWILGLGSAAERKAFEDALESDRELRNLVEALEEGAAIYAMSVSPVAVPENLRDRVMSRLDPETAAEGDRSEPWAMEVLPGGATRPVRFRVRETLAWAAALILAIASAWLWRKAENERALLAEASARIGQLEAKLLAAEKNRDLAEFQIASLRATIDAYQQGVALVIWDESKQEGVLKLEKMPPIPVDKDYQLWVVDPSHETPVNAGVVQVSPDGFARVTFKPTDIVSKAEKFAISVERRGGVAVNEGPIVLLSE